MADNKQKESMLNFSTSSLFNKQLDNELNISIA